jgi:hypothetical protein
MMPSVSERTRPVLEYIHELEHKVRELREEVRQLREQPLRFQLSVFFFGFAGGAASVYLLIRVLAQA